MVKNGKPTLQKLENLVETVTRNVAEIKETMATKKDLRSFATKVDLEGVERRLSAKIEAVDEKLDALEAMSAISSGGCLCWKKMLNK